MAVLQACVAALSSMQILTMTCIHAANLMQPATQPRLNGGTGDTEEGEKFYDARERRKGRRVGGKRVAAQLAPEPGE